MIILENDTKDFIDLDDIDIKLPFELQTNIVTDIDTQNFINLDDIDNLPDTNNFMNPDFLDTDTQNYLELNNLDEANIVGEDSTDYILFLNSLYQYVFSSYSSLNSKKTCSKEKLVLPFSEDDLPFFNAREFEIYVEIWNEVLRQDINLPNANDLLQLFLDKFENLGWSLNLAKDKFSYIFNEHYKQLLNSLVSYENINTKSNELLYENSDFTKIKDTLKEIKSLVEFPNFCNDILIRDSNIDLILNLHNKGLKGFFHPFTSKPLETLLDMQNSCKDLLRSEQVISYIKEALIIDCTASTYGEIIRLLCIVYADEYTDIGELWYKDNSIINNIDFVWQYLIQKKGNGDVLAFILSIIVLIILYGIKEKNKNNIEELQKFYTLFLKYIYTLNTDKSFRNINVISNLKKEDEKIYTTCNNGEKYPVNNNFYIITGYDSQVIISPLCINCSCPDKNCCGKLFPLSMFIENLYSWIKRESLTRINNLKFKLNLGYKSLYELGLDIETEEDKFPILKINPIELDKFIQFENHISKFKFKDNSFEPEFINFTYHGLIHIDHDNFFIDEECFVRVTGINFTNNHNKLLKLIIDDTIITEGVWELSNTELQLFFYMDNISTEINLTLPVSKLKAVDDNINNYENDTTSITCLDKIFNTNFSDVNNLDSEKIAKCMCELTGLPYHILLRESENLVVSEYLPLLNLQSLEILLYKYIAKTYIPLIKSEFGIDTVNFSMLKNLLRMIEGDKNILEKYSCASDITYLDKKKLLEFLEEPLSLESIIKNLNSIDISILSFNLSVSSKDISDKDLELYHACLSIPPIGEILLNLQNQIIIFKTLLNFDNDLDSLVRGNSYILKNYKNALSIQGLTELTDGLKKRFKNYKNTEFFPCSEKLISIKHDDNYILLKYYILNNKLFEVMNTLLLIEDSKLVLNILNDLHSDIDLNFFMNINNAEIFYKKFSYTTINSIFNLYGKELLDYICKGILYEIYSKGYTEQVICFDLLLNFSDDLLSFSDFEKETLNYTDDFFTLFGSLYLTYCKAGDETIMNEFADRKNIFLRHCDEFPEINSSYFKKLPLKDYLYISDGNDIIVD